MKHMKIKFLALSGLLLAAPAIAAETGEFAGATLACYLLLNLALGSMLVFALIIFAALWRERRRGKARLHFVNRQKQGSRSSEYVPVVVHPRRGNAGGRRGRRLS